MAPSSLGRHLERENRLALEMPKRKTKPRRSNNPNGRPSSGLTERVLLAVTPWMAGAMRELAAREGVSASEAWRAAARHWLNWPDVPPATTEEGP